MNSAQAGSGGRALVEGLSRPACFPNESPTQIEVVETHISWVFLTDCFAYKVKKPIKNAFLDYSTLELRKYFCHEELRLDRRYAPELYRSVVPITRNNGVYELGGQGEICEYAVQMRRFPADALLDRRLQRELVNPCQIKSLAERIADFHRSASAAPADGSHGAPQAVFDDALDNLDALANNQDIAGADERVLQELREWTRRFFQEHKALFARRKQDDCIRECHGDLHCGNIVFWDGQFTPFDGIEFNERFRWIDVLSDVAFLAMDLRVREHQELSDLFLSSYLERTGDYLAPALLRWYQVYRALVRAKVANIVMTQHDETTQQFRSARKDRSQLLSLAHHLTHPAPPTLWITHGLSGSGKSTGAESLVQRESAIRIRADVERKRIFGQAANFRPSPAEAMQLYSSDMTHQTYHRLHELAQQILRAGFSVVVDATFLKREQRAMFASLASDVHLPFRILDCQADFKTLQQRLLQRKSAAGDASDADRAVLQKQTASCDPLNESERQHSVVFLLGNDGSHASPA